MPNTENVEPASFEAALKELEALVATLENGATPLEEALAAYERGVYLTRYCQQRLDAAEQRIRILDGDALRDFAEAPVSAASGDDA